MKKGILGLLMMLCMACILLPATVFAETNVVSVDFGGNTTNYTTFDDAWAAALACDTTASNKATITLLADTSTATTQFTDAADYLILDTNGKTLTLTTSGSGCIKVTGGALDIKGTGIITGSNSDASGIVYITAGSGSLTDASIKATSGYALAVSGQSANFTMYSGTLHTDSQYAVNVQGRASCTMHSGTVDGFYDAGILVQQDSNLLLAPESGKTIEIQNANSTGGLIFQQIASLLNVEGGTARLYGAGTVNLTAGTNLPLVQGVSVSDINGSSGTFELINGALNVDVSGATTSYPHNTISAFSGKVPTAANSTLAVKAGADQGSSQVVSSPTDATYTGNNYVSIAATHAYTVTYNKGTGSGTVPNPQHGTGMTPTTVDATYPLTKAGYVQTGWTTGSERTDGAGKVTSVSDTVTMYPVWTYAAMWVDLDGAGSGAPTLYSDFATGWNAAVGSGNTSNTTVTLMADWVGDNTEAHKLGTGDGFGSSGDHSFGDIYVPKAKTITLDLNDYSIDRKGVVFSAQIEPMPYDIYNGGTLTIKSTDRDADSSTSGQIKGADDGIVSFGNLVINENVTITENSTGLGLVTSGANVTTTLNGVCITKNKTGVDARGAHCPAFNGTPEATNKLYLCGTTVIQGNWYMDDETPKTQNLVVQPSTSSYTFTFGSGAQGLRAGARIGVTVADPVSAGETIAVSDSNATNYSSYFFSDSYQGKIEYNSNNQQLIYHAGEIASISVKTPPTKTTYTAGEMFAPAGLVLTVNYTGVSGLSFEDVPYTGNEGMFLFSPALTTALATTNTSVTITFGGKTAQQAVTVKGPPVDLSSDDAKFYQPQLWDCQRSPAFPRTGRTLSIYGLKAPYDQSLHTVDFNGGTRYVRFAQSDTATLGQLSNAEALVSSLKRYLDSSVTADQIKAAALVKETLYEANGTEVGVISNYGLVFALNEKGFLYVSLSDALCYSGGVGTFVSNAALKNSSSIVIPEPQLPPYTWPNIHNNEFFNPGGDPISPQNATFDLAITLVGSDGVSVGNAQKNVPITLTYHSASYSGTTDTNGRVVFSGLVKADATFAAQAGPTANLTSYSGITIPDSGEVSLIYTAVSGTGSAAPNYTVTLENDGTGSGTLLLNASPVASGSSITVPKGGSAICAWSAADGSKATTVTGTSDNTAALTNGYVELSNILANATVTVTFSKIEETPNAAFAATGPDTGTLTNVTSAMKYKIGSGAWQPISGTSVDLTGLSACTISLYQPNANNSVLDSAVQTITVTKAAAPAAGKADCTTLANTDGKLTGVSTVMEYEKVGGSWQNGTGSDITGLSDGTYYVRVKANGTALSSENQTLAIAAFTGTPEAIPTAGIDYENEQLISLTANVAYTVNGGSAIADSNGKITIAPAWFNTTISIVKLGNGTTTTDSVAQSLAIPARPTLSGVGKTNCQILQQNDGTLTGVTTAMAYRSMSAGGTWSDWADGNGNITGIGAGTTYEVKLKAVAGSSFASDVNSFVVAAYNAVPEATPTAAIDYTNEQLNGLELNGTYTINGAAKTADANGKIVIDPAWMADAPISIVKLGNGETTKESDAQQLTIPARPAAPTGIGKTACTNANNDGILTGVTDAMAYQIAGGAWQNCGGTTVTGLVPGSYYVRYQATTTAFASISTAEIVILQQYPIEYLLNGGTNDQANPITYNAESAFSLADPTRTGFAFVGWTYAGQDTPAAVSIAAGTVGAKSYMARWKANTPIAAPTGFAVSAKTDTMLTFAGTAGYEYSIDGGTTWQAPTGGAIAYTGLTASTGYTVQCRVAEITTVDLLAYASDAYTIETIMTEASPTDGKGSISGMIVGPGNRPIQGVTITLMKFGTNGTPYATAATDSFGNYSFSAQPYGSYSLVAVNGSQKITRQSMIESPFVAENFVMLQGSESTTVEVGQNTPSVAAQNLEKMFTSTDQQLLLQQTNANIDIKLSVKQEEAGSLPAVTVQKISAVLPQNTVVGMYLDAKLLRTVTGSTNAADNGTTSIQPPAGESVLIVIDLPESLRGKPGYGVAALHGQAAKQIVGVSYDAVSNTLSFPADGFSTFAITYQQAPLQGSGNNQQASTQATLYNPATGDASHLLLWKLMFALSLCGIGIFCFGGKLQ